VLGVLGVLGVFISHGEPISTHKFLLSCLGFCLDGSQPRLARPLTLHMKRPHALEDAGDRAQKHRKPGMLRISLDKIGFWPGNRGGLGLASHHIHEVAWDCKANKTKLQRYVYVDLIEIPKDRLQQIRDANRERCEADELMPRFSEHIQYVCASKTHFCHAQKLAKDGKRTVFNKGEVHIRWQESDEEGLQIMHHGPMCAIYDSSLLHDTDAANALASDDNLNAAVQWGEDEMQAFGRVHEMMERTPSQCGRPVTVDDMVASLQVAGLGKFSSDDWKEIIALRSSLPATIAKVLQACQFNACASRVRVRPSDFGLSAKLDPRAPWTKVAVLLWQYIGAMDQNRTSVNAMTFGGRKEVVAKKMQADVVKELAAETDFLRSVDTFIKAMLSTYSTPPSQENMASVANELLAARGELLANCGRYLLKVGSVLDQAAKKAMSRRVPLEPTDRLRILKDECAGKFSKMEDYYRKELVTRKLYTEGALPAAVHPMKDDSTQTPPIQQEISSAHVGSQPSGVKAKGTKSGGQGGQQLVCGAPATLTEAHVFERLGVQGCGEEVMTLIGVGSNSAVKTEAPDESSGLVDAGEGSQPSDGTWRIARLISLSLPQAVVQQLVDGVWQTITVCVDDLRPVIKLTESRVILHPSLQEGGTILDSYDYDIDESYFTQVVVKHALLWTHLCTHSCVEHVTLSRLSDQGKLPFILQVRALEPFRKGALVLVPARGEILPGTVEDDQLAHSQGVVHEAMLPHVQLKLIAGSHRRRRASDTEPKITPFVIRSPLLDGKKKKDQDTCMENIAPFWAVLRCVGPKASHNMEFDTMVFRDTGCDAKTGQFPKLAKGVEFSVEIPILRNVSHISKGELLCLPFFEK